MMEDLLYWIATKIVIPIVVVITLALFFVGLPMWGWSVYKQSQSPTFELYKNQWTCSQSHREDTTMYVQSGKVLVPVTSHEKVCDQWTRKETAQ